jgi:hypothetical protein
MTKQPMAFYHEDGLVAAWKFASKYAGQGGRIATLPDIIDARLATNTEAPPWSRYFTTASAEYFGRARDGSWVVIVAHGVGPMATLDGVLAAYKHEFKDKSRHNRGGRITQQQFWDLLEGKFGEVAIVPLNDLLLLDNYPFNRRHQASEIMHDPLLMARLGPRAIEFVDRYREIAREWHVQRESIVPENRYDERNWETFLQRRRHQHIVDRHNPYLIFSSGASNCSYGYRQRDGRFEIPYADDEVVAHLISIGQLTHMNHDGRESLVTDIECHEWWNGVRFVGVPAGTTVRTIKSGPESTSRLVRKHWAKLLRPVDNPTPPGFSALVKVGSKFFTQYPKRGARIDTGEPEYEVISSRKIGLPVEFETEIGGFEGFFRYHITEVSSLAPRVANAYQVLGTPDIIYEGGNPVRHRVRLQFYEVTVNPAMRIMRADELSKDYDRLMALVN